MKDLSFPGGTGRALQGTRLRNHDTKERMPAQEAVLVHLQDWNMQVIHRDDNLDSFRSPAPPLGVVSNLSVSIALSIK